VDRNVIDTSPMAGLGFGLPVSRLYAKYFGGDVEIQSMEGYGCDVYIRLDHIGDVIPATLKIKVAVWIVRFRVYNF